MGRNASFSADDETASTLRDLGYTDEEISRTAGSLPDSMATEDRLRLSLRALSAHNSEEVSRRAEESAPAPNPKLRRTDPVDDSEAYWRGRKDQAAQSKQNKPPKSATPRQPRAPKPP